jgi:hypothetical protein
VTAVKYGYRHVLNTNKPHTEKIAEALSCSCIEHAKRQRGKTLLAADALRNTTALNLLNTILGVGALHAGSGQGGRGFFVLPSQASKGNLGLFKRYAVAALGTALS